ncbi:MAG: hypothetical protein J6P55_01770 [Bacteroidaceae bacterium]|nr:hypothetical protein [Bacteroidaceae bacterium]
MKSKKIALFSCAALVAAGIGLNIQNALANYGIGENSLSLVAGPGSNSGSNSNSNSNSNLNSNTDTLPDISDSDSNGNGNNDDKWSIESGDCPYEFEGNPGDTINFSIGNFQHAQHVQYVFGTKRHLTYTVVGGKEDCVRGNDYPTCTPKPCPPKREE